MRGVDMSDDFGSILQEFKDKEDADSIVPLVDDEDLRKGIVAWKSVVIKYKSVGDCPHEDEASRWNWLWDNVGYDSGAFGEVAGARAQDVGRLLHRLAGLRLIYPDGTIHQIAKKYLQTTILSKLKSVQPKGSKGQAPVPPSDTSEKSA